MNKVLKEVILHKIEEAKAILAEITIDDEFIQNPLGCVEETLDEVIQYVKHL